MTEERQDPRIDVRRNRCPYCHDAVAPDQPKVACEGCMAWHHRECWDTHGTCSACGGGAGSIRPAAPTVTDPKAAEDPRGVLLGEIRAGRRCAAVPCHESPVPGQMRCERHLLLEGKALMGIGASSVVFWVGLVAALGASWHGDLGGMALLLGSLGALMAVWGFKQYLDARATLRRAREAAEPERDA